MHESPEAARKLVSGRVFLLSGIGLLLFVALLASLWVLVSGTESAGPTFYGTPTPTPAHTGLPF